MKSKIIYNSIFIVLLFIILFLSLSYFELQNEYSSHLYNEMTQKKETININYFWDNFKLQDYNQTSYKITEEWKNIINTARNQKTIKNYITPSQRDKDLCAWYDWIITQKIWWDNTPYHIWMANQKTHSPAKAWELPYYYSTFWWKILVDLSEKFNIQKKDYLEKISTDDIKNLFLTAFSEESLLWDIWFLYINSHYLPYLNWWTKNSHITKNLWITNFSYEVKAWDTEFYKILWCDKKTYEKFKYTLENYKIYLNNKQIIYKNNDFFYLNNKNQIENNVIFTFWDKLSITDVVITHFYDWKARVDSLFEFTCKWEFLPVNITSINPRFIEKM